MDFNVFSDLQFYPTLLTIPVAKIEDFRIHVFYESSNSPMTVVYVCPPLCVLRPITDCGRGGGIEKFVFPFLDSLL